MPYPELAEYFASREEALVARWRLAARAADTQACQRLHLSDAEIDDHLLALLADPRLGRAAEIIERQARYQARLLDDLLEVSRIALGKIELKREEVPLQAAVRHAVESCRPAIEAKSLRLGVEVPEDALVV